ncbi:MAG: prepilin-type cleavage/methylation domain-containing protein, partial [Desulfobacteraceae bacterium]|nr:prepilin-type cleavage/methylation domain-containing protein [Desulfobacteraceae bacterium]
MQKRSGFTLIQLTIVIALLAILTAVGVPNFLSWLPKYRLKSAARDLYSNLHLAKMSAIKANKDCMVKYYKNP